MAAHHGTTAASMLAGFGVSVGSLAAAMPGDWRPSRRRVSPDCLGRIRSIPWQRDTSLDVAPPPANALIREFVWLDILKEVTVQKRGWVFVFQRYLSLFAKAVSCGCAPEGAPMSVGFAHYSTYPVVEH